ncbi:MAG TPA: hypothetical protein VLG50_04790 [Candidatus Saccharimonadales bacterium]|nr:hypothetical protein [Candidatus Saccharimonadales bacterium]
MFIGRIIFSVFACWLGVVKHIVLLNPLYLFKIGFLWFFLAFAMTYLFFLVCHRNAMIHIRRDIAIELAYSLWWGFLSSTAFVALYECILSLVVKSEFFKIHQSMIYSLSLMSGPDVTFYRILSCMIVFTSAFFAYNSVLELLSNWCEKAVFNHYGLYIVITSLICWGFLWFLAFV